MLFFGEMVLGWVLRPWGTAPCGFSLMARGLRSPPWAASMAMVSDRLSKSLFNISLRTS